MSDPVGVAATAGAAVRLHAGRHAGELDVAAMAAHRRQAGGFGDDDADRLHLAHQCRSLRGQSRALLGGLLVGGDQQRDRDVLGQCARGDDGGGDRALHVGAAEAMQDTVGAETRRPGILLPAGVGHRVHVTRQRDAAGGAAMRHQRALRHAGFVAVVDALDVEAGESRFDPVGDRQVGDEAAAVDGDEFTRQGDDGCMGVTHWRLSSPVFLPGCYEPTRLAAPQEDMTNRNSDDGDD